MSTLEDCQRAGQLYKMTPQLRGHQQECRTLYVTKEVRAWMFSVLRTATTDGFTVGASSPLQQFAAQFRRYAAGEALEWPHPRKMSPREDGIWRFKTADVRLAGWFLAPCQFIAADAELKENCDNMRDNQMFQNTLRVRGELGLLNGHFERGDLDELL